jgi:DNA-binding FadR family transcriptional regulator
MPLQPVQRQSVTDAVFAQLLEGVLSGELDAGEELPGERALTEALGANREALQRLAAAGLVEIRHGGRTRVRNYRHDAGLNLLPRLLVGAGGAVDTAVARGLMELRACLGVDAARRSAARATADLCSRISSLAQQMHDAGGDLKALADLDMAFWDAVIDGAGNIAYRLAFNSMRHTYEPMAELLRDTLAPELTDHSGRNTLAAAIAAGDESAAAAAAQRLLARGEDAISGLLTALDAAGPREGR